MTMVMLTLTLMTMAIPPTPIQTQPHVVPPLHLRFFASHVLDNTMLVVLSPPASFFLHSSVVYSSPSAGSLPSSFFLAITGQVHQRTNLTR